MANMGLSDLAIAARRPINMDDARMMACGAMAVLDGRREFSSLGEAVADCGMVIGTTARRGLYRCHSLTPREWAPRILDVARHSRVALVFGPEDNGLSNEELTLCTHVMQIPSSEDCPSLNLSHAVIICAYELFLASGLFVPSQERSPLAPSRMRERMFELWREALLEIGFMKEDKAVHMMFGLRRILSRGSLTEDDVRIMIGIARQTLWKARQPALESLSDALPSDREESPER
jgi:tRNA/rRNA methyltransferase